MPLCDRIAERIDWFNLSVRIALVTGLRRCRRRGSALIMATYRPAHALERLTSAEKLRSRLWKQLRLPASPVEVDGERIK